MSELLQRLEAAIVARRGASPDSSYVASLFAKGREKIAQKVGEEATETVIAALSGNPADLTAEAPMILAQAALWKGILYSADARSQSWRLTGGAIHATDATNASRTLLFNIGSFEWDELLLRFFNVPRAMLPSHQASASHFGSTKGLNFLPDGIPVCGIAGDQQ